MDVEDSNLAELLSSIKDEDDISSPHVILDTTDDSD